MEYTAISFPIKGSSILLSVELSENLMKSIDPAILERNTVRRDYVHIYDIRDGKICLTALDRCKRLLGFNVTQRYDGVKDYEYSCDWLKEWIISFNGPVYPVTGNVSGKTAKPNEASPCELGFVFADPTDAMLFKMGCPFDHTTTVFTEENFE